MDDLFSNRQDPLSLDDLQNEDNIAELLDDQTLSRIGDRVLSGYRIDIESRAEWQEIINKALKIAKQTMDTKNLPWPDASNMKFPLITKAAIDFASHAYPEIVQNDRLVKVTATGNDYNQDGDAYNGPKALRASNVQTFLHYQLLEQSDDWQESMDKLLHILPILGTAFKKNYWDPVRKKICYDICQPDKIVVNYNITALDCARRVTHELVKYANDIVMRMNAKIFKEYPMDTLLSMSGSAMGEDKYSIPIELLEQHCWLDLDGDGYEEPYIVTVHKASSKVLRIYNRFKEIKYVDDTARNKKVLFIEAEECFIDYHFIKSPDGGYYSVGFGTMLYPLNQAINIIFNQLVDAGTLNNQQAGFIGRGLRMKNGEIRLKLGEWKVLDAAAGTDIQKNIVPLPTKEPSAVLYQLLGMMVDVGKDLASINDVMDGSQAAQNVPATTVLALLEQGMKVRSAIHKRIYRALQKEFKQIYYLDRKYLDDSTYQRVIEQHASVAADFAEDGCQVLPVADPSMSSNMERLQKAQIIATVPGVNPYQASHTMLESLQLDQKLITALLPKPDPNAPPTPQVQEIMSNVQLHNAQAELFKAQAQVAVGQPQVDAMDMQIKRAELDLKAQKEAANVMVQQHKIVHDDTKLQLQAAKETTQAHFDKVDLINKISTDHEKLRIDRARTVNEIMAGRDKAHADMQKSMQKPQNNT